MHARLWAVLLAIVLGGTAYNAAASVPLEVFGRLPSIEDVAVSPDGSRIAFTRTTVDERVVYIISVADQKLLGYVNTGKAKLRSVSWADNERVLFITSSTGFAQVFGVNDAEFSYVRTYEVATGKLEDPLAKMGVSNFIAGRPMVRRIDGETVLFVAGFLGGKGTVLLRINLAGIKARFVDTGDVENRAWLVDANGTVRTAQTYSSSKKRWGIKILRNNELTEVTSGQAAIDLPSVEGFAPEGDAVWVHMMENGNPVRRALSLQDGKLGPALTQANQLDTLIRDPYSDRILGGVPVGIQSSYVFFDTQLQQDWQTALRTFADEHIDIVSRAADTGQMILLVQGRQHGLSYVYFDPKSGMQHVIGPAYEGLTEVSATYGLSYPAADGLEIPAVLTVPNLAQRKNLPLIVMPHGGPEAHDTTEFSWWAQALAAQGYVVLQPNFRGSDLTWKLQAAGFGEWGRKMQTDLSDGVQFLAETGLVDPKRVCIVGASYGGYAALAGVSLQSGVYRCAVSVAGISNLIDFERDVFGGTNTRFAGVGMRYLDRYLGVSDDKKNTLLASLSPTDHADAVSVPVLIIHGKNDAVVPYRQSELMNKALQRAGKQVQFITLKQEDHWLSRSETRLQMLQDSTQFLLKYNPPNY